MPVETEIKLRVPEGAEWARQLLERHGLGEASPRQLESDEVYDFPEWPLRRSGCLLRLRHSGTDWVLTYKGPPHPGRHKSRQEIETKLADGIAMRAILQSLGYIRIFLYEKFRTKFLSAGGSDGVVTLDETPIGSFLELEGPGYWIDEMAARLGFNQNDFLTKSYALLYQEHLAANPNAPSNMTFS